MKTRPTSAIRYACIVATLALSSCSGLQRHHRVGNERKDSKKPGASVLVKAVLRSTIGATARAPVAATKTGAVMLYDRLHTLLLGNSPTQKLLAKPGSTLPPKAGGGAFEQLLDQERLPAPSLGSVDFFIDGRSFFPAYLQTIADARIGIDVQSYIIDNDDFAVEIAGALKAKSAHVPVRVYFDGSGSLQAAAQPPPAPKPGFAGPKDIGDYLRQASGVRSRRTANPYFVADHTKLHIVDGRVAFVGGMNVGREYRSHWHDLMARIEGPVVRDLMQLFERNWRADGWWRKFGREPNPAAAAPEPDDPRLQPLRILQTDIRSGKREILKASLLAFRSASRRIWIQTPFFSSDEVTKELENALRRGVDVRVIIPGDNEHAIMEANNAAELAKLMKLGGKVYAYPGMTHLKATVCDDWAMFGSANYDTLSMRLNRELNLATSDPRSVGYLAAKVFERDFRTARLLTLADLKAEGGPLAEFVGDQL